MFIETYLPQCLAIGISEEKFWTLNIKKLHPYQKAEELKRDKLNADFHLMGCYVFEAVATVVDNALRKEGTSPKRYLEKPFELATYDEKKIAERNKRKAEEIEARFRAFAMDHNKRLSEEK